MTALSLHGVFTALVTPFTDDGSAIDFDAFRRLLELQLEAKVAGVVPCGTTGEAPTLTSAEQLELIRFTKDVVKGEILVLAGAGSNATQKSIDAVKAALREETEAAAARGVFGAPTFIVGGTELYWGQDRLGLVEEALST